MSAGPVVLKFGGTSVGDAEAIGRLVRHVSAAHVHAGAVVVVSALSGVTDRLLTLAATAAAGARPTRRWCRRASRTCSSATSRWPG